MVLRAVSRPRPVSSTTPLLEALWSNGYHLCPCTTKPVIRVKLLQIYLCYLWLVLCSRVTHVCRISVKLFWNVYCENAVQMILTVCCVFAVGLSVLYIKQPFFLWLTSAEVGSCLACRGGAETAGRGGTYGVESDGMQMQERWCLPPRMTSVDMIASRWVWMMWKGL